jgi:succinate dehydrogenase / fumarate reductase cytochrome b subunit
MERKTFFGTSIGKKVLMAATGLVLYGFVITHMIGNLQVYLGPKALDAYAEFLHQFLHGAGIWVAVTLTQGNRAARKVGYRQWQGRQSTYASRTMIWSGLILALFIAYHLAHFTIGAAHPDFKAGQVFNNVVVGFQNPAVAGLYIVAMGALGMHMYHGFWSLFQTLGLSDSRTTGLRRSLSLALAGGVVLGNISIPISVLTGIIHL